MSESLIKRRARLLGPNLATFYDQPLHLVRGSGVWLWDADGCKYLDCYNNVPHVGHCHPKVVQAIATQAAALNTHSRYLHAGVLDYVEALTSNFSHDLSQVIMVCTGSEANDVALRMARAVTGKRGIIATDNTYHGNTAAVSQLTAGRQPIGGHGAHVRLVPAPDSQHPVGGSLHGQAEAFARNIAGAIVELEDTGIGFAGFMLCPVFANEGLPDLPGGFLEPAIGVVHRARGLVLCDEVQPGFGRVGTHWWGHERMGFAPDVVTLGKPMANGHPVAAVVTRPDIMAEFREAFGYFNTFGGNPVSAAAAMATLQVIEEEGLVENAHVVGAYTLERMQALQHPLIAQVRGQGLFFAIEFVDRGQPAADFTHHVVEAMKREGVLVGSVGRHGNILKLRPPLVLSRENADLAVDTLAGVLREARDDDR